MKNSCEIWLHVCFVTVLQVYSPSKENESPPVERYNDAAELEKEQKIDDEKNRQEEQQVKTAACNRQLSYNGLTPYCTICDVL